MRDKDTLHRCGAESFIAGSSRYGQCRDRRCLYAGLSAGLPSHTYIPTCVFGFVIHLASKLKLTVIVENNRRKANTAEVGAYRQTPNRLYIYPLLASQVNLRYTKWSFYSASKSQLKKKIKFLHIPDWFKKRNKYCWFISISHQYANLAFITNWITGLFATFLEQTL